MTVTKQQWLVTLSLESKALIQVQEKIHILSSHVKYNAKCILDLPLNYVNKQTVFFKVLLDPADGDIATLITHCGSVALLKYFTEIRLTYKYLIFFFLFPKKNKGCSQIKKSSH